MDNIKDENLKKLGKYIAESLFDLSRDTDREEYEKCAIMKLRIQDIKSMLKIDGDLDINLEDNEK